MSGLNRKDDARREAQRLIALLKGTGWKPIIHKNMDWYFKAVSGPVQVYPASDGSRRYWCMIGSDAKGSPGGAGFWTPQRTRYFKDPNRAVKDALSHVYPFVEKINETLEAAERAAGITQPAKRKERGK